MKWFEPPFAFSHFKIKNEEQIKTIRSLGLKVVRCNPTLSEVSLPHQVAAQDMRQQVTLQTTERTAPDIGIAQALAAKYAMIERIQRRHASRDGRQDGAKNYISIRLTSPY